MASSGFEQKKMASTRHYPSHSSAPSAPELSPESYHHHQEIYSYNHHGSPPSDTYYGQQAPSSYGQSGFPAGTHPDALSSGYERFNIRTIRLLMFLFKNPHDSLRIAPREFAALWSCLGHWRAIFERFDRDRSGKIDLMELRDALYSLGYAIPPSVLQVLISKYDNGSGRRVELNFDSFVEA
ncbi:hypothetical protein DITRI_Ditri14bG0042800 [Diplodiscus trichospermus]